MDYGVWSAPYNARFVYLLNGRSTMERSTIHFEAPFKNTDIYCSSKCLVNSSSYTKLPNVANICAVDAGFSHALLLNQDGEVYSCGKKNDYGELGRVVYSNASTPIMIPNLPRITSVR